MSEWREMYVWPYAPHDRTILGLTHDGQEIEVSFHPGKQRWVDGDDQPVNITHWRELDRA